ncbi:MAG: putative deoxyribonuclease RhsB [Chlamydiae bacterium]|nr:putative deoxyribonuclease RhsB [Chlamydiota bacterium]
MRKLLLLLLLFCISLFPKNSTPQELASMQGDSAAYVCGCVNAITGDLVFEQLDLIVQGAQKLPFIRKHTSREATNPDLSWKPCSHDVAISQSFSIDPTIPQQLFIKEPNGVTIKYCLAGEKKKGKDLVFLPFPVQFESGISAYCQDQLGGRYHPKQNVVFWLGGAFVLETSSGEVRRYKREKEETHKLEEGLYAATCYFYLEREQLSNGNILTYKYEKDQLKEIKTRNPSDKKTYSSLKFAHKKDGKITVTSSDQQKLEYIFKRYRLSRKKKQKTSFLCEAKTAEYPEEQQKRDKKTLLLTSRCFPNQRVLSLEYDKKKRVTKINGPDGNLAQLFYHENATESIDADGNKTLYEYNPKTLRLTKISHFQDLNTLCKIEAFTWNLSGCLESKTILSPEVIPILKISYQYDGKLNPISKTISGDEDYTFFYQYDDQNRLIEESEDNGRQTTYEYLENTSLLVKKIVSKSGPILQRTLYEYNADLILVCEITDAGENFTERHIKRITPREHRPYYGLPSVIEELYLENGIETLRTKIALAYDEYGNVKTKITYGSDGQTHYTTKIQYNEKGQIIEETNALGHKTKYTYDENGNKTKEVTPLGLNITYSYDTCNRLTAKTETDEQQTFTTLYEDFDAHDNSRKITNPLGCVTCYTYDALGNLIRTRDPSGAIAHYEYDVLGHQMSVTDPKSHTTTTTNNTQGNPLQILHPDSAQETFTYNPDQTKASYTDPNGTKTLYFYDNFGHIKREEIYDHEDNFIGQITRKYNAFHLLEETNLEGYKTTYTYNSAGQCIKKTYEDQETIYAYDLFGNCTAEATGDYKAEKTFDLLGRVIEEKEFSDDIILTQTETKYDALDHPIKITSYPNNQEVSTHFTYDKFGREIQKIDPLGRTTSTEYRRSDNQFHKITHEPGDLTNIEISNDLDQLISIERKNPNEETLSLIHFQYDLCGNTTKETTTIFRDTTPITNHTLEWTYDSRNRKKVETEALIKTTKFSYTPTGNLHLLEKPDGTKLTYTYDPLGYFQSLTSSRDLIHNTQTSRIVDPHGNILQETLANGYTLQSSYDSQGRRECLKLPMVDKTIHYSYRGPYLQKVSCDDFSFTYCYDYSGNLIDNTLITLAYDSRSRPITLTSPQFYQHCAYDIRGNMASIESTHGRKEFTYDDYDHLIHEPQNSYSYDSLHNRIAKNDIPLILNTLNQIESPDHEYDLNGNLTRLGDTHLLYDSLDRLITVKTPTHSHLFTYDAEHRRLTKNHTLYIWDGNHELGTLDEYRILGPTPHAEIGSAITIFIDEKPFLPIHDLHGNLIQLLTPNQDLSLEQTFTAFGEGESKLSWGFSSKRHDPETDLIYFGRRFYDPKHGHFISPDPEGYTDSSNLYAFVLNNPLINRDPYGLIMARYDPRWFGMEPLEPFDFTKLKDFSSGLWNSTLNGAASCGIDNMQFFGSFPTATLDIAKMPITASSGTANEIGDWFSHTRTWHTTMDHAQNWANVNIPHRQDSYANMICYGLGYASTEMGIAVTTLGTSLFKHFGKIPEIRSTLKTMNVSRSIFQPRKTGNLSTKVSNIDRRRKLFKPDPNAYGSHTVYKRDPQIGKVTKYETYQPQTNPYDPKPWERVKRYDGSPTKDHWNKFLKRNVGAPHVHDPYYPGGVRPAMPWEIPK